MPLRSGSHYSLMTSDSSSTEPASPRPRLQRSRRDNSESEYPHTFDIWLQADHKALCSEQGDPVSVDLAAQLYAQHPDQDIPRRVVETDSQHEEYLAFLEHHPAFRQALEDLALKPDTEAFELFATEWRIAVADLWHLAEAAALGALGGVRLPPLGARVRVEVYASELVVRVPYPVTPASRDTVIRWARDAWRNPERWASTAPSRGLPPAGKSAHLATEAIRRLDWYDRWHHGESAHEIWQTLPVKEASVIAEHNVRNTLQQIHRRLQEISPKGLRTPGTLSPPT